MGETKESKLKPLVKCSDENQVPLKCRNSNVQPNLKPRSIWGSNIVKGFSGDKKTRSQQVSKKAPLQPVTTVGNANSKNPFSQNRAKRSLMGDLSCSVTATQVHPQGVQLYKSTSSSGSRDLFAELDQLRSLLQESKDREAKLQGELCDFKKKNLKALELERTVESKTSEINALKSKIDLLESENASLSEQLNSQQLQENIAKGGVNGVEVDVLKLRRLNAELHLQKRNLCFRISSMESELAALAKDSKNEFVEKIKAEASMLQQTNEDLCKQVEDLQVSRLNEVEELVYLRWVNSCLKNELQNTSCVTSEVTSSPASVEWLNGSVSSDGSSEHGSAQKTLSLIKKMKKWPVLDEETNASEPANYKLNLGWSEGRRHSISGANCCQEDLVVDERAVLKHFDWPEKKADTLREAAFAYRDLKKLEHEISNYKDNYHIPCDLALKKMVSLSEKMERIVYNLLRTRDQLVRNCKEFHIPTDWMLDSGILNKIKLGSVKLAKKYLRRVATELQTKGTSEKDSSMDYMLLQGVRFAFRIHQFAGGFDVDTMHAFEELRNVALVLNKK
ncbi:hypothetical protein M8C21_022516 [Ambrosia artemisiifolia]|uniref:Protein CHUP1, chloroplastic-like protein n=1 Tax=Ambrosia artemisiifolia TaxID=4212 RepID=A0AAD5BRQ6_AMBAR|nr:hypothetical protein M8C21_022516 [Ambrosia artemisiifolia]